MRAISLLVLAAACGPAAEESGSLVVGSASSVTDGGTWTVTWAPVPDPIPLNEIFQIEASISDSSGALVTDADVVVSGGMSSHGHGMNTTPETTNHGDGSYTVEGLLFHMPGTWTLTFDVSVGATTERASADIDCCAGG